MLQLSFWTLSIGVSETGICLRLQVEPIHVDRIKKAGLSPYTVA
jgi:hypothetical protein